MYDRKNRIASQILEEVLAYLRFFKVPGQASRREQLYFAALSLNIGDHARKSFEPRERLQFAFVVTLKELRIVRLCLLQHAFCR
ncbi:hypothetical protein WT05_04405 [Burkholderia stagnalis]|nr:hypothetical protein WT05_04405 [Burkholderia stagnalis]